MGQGCFSLVFTAQPGRWRLQLSVDQIELKPLMFDVFDAHERIEERVVAEQAHRHERLASLSERISHILHQSPKTPIKSIAEPVSSIVTPTSPSSPLVSQETSNSDANASEPVQIGTHIMLSFDLSDCSFLCFLFH
jgi:hypothetical protein